METCAHKDQSRRQVSGTADFTAACRAYESTKPEAERLCYDPFARVLVGESGMRFQRELTAAAAAEVVATAAAAVVPIDRFVAGMLKRIAAVAVSSPDERALPQNRRIVKLGNFIDVLAVRTHWFESQLADIVADIRRAGDGDDDDDTDDVIVQVVLVGSGLDTRAFRLPCLAGAHTHVYELDFASVHAHKAAQLATMAPSPPQPVCGRHIPVSVDLSIVQDGDGDGDDDGESSSWTSRLVDAGFDVMRPVVWLLEGFTGYLSADELTSLLTCMSSVTASPVSRVLATFNHAASHDELGLHRFKTNDAPALLATHGWRATQTHIRDLAVKLGRADFITVEQGYWLVTGLRAAASAATATE